MVYSPCEQGRGRGVERNFRLSPQDRGTRRPSLPFCRRLPQFLKQLETVIEEAQAKSWEGLECARAAEAAEALAAACRAEGLREAATVSRSLAALLQVPGAQIKPIERAFRKKLKEMLDVLRQEGESALGTG